MRRSPLRYLGNKRRLLDRIVDCAANLGFRSGTVCDLFAGSGVVGRHFRSLGHRVLSADLMDCSYVFQKVFLELEGPPQFATLASQLELGRPADSSRVPEDSPFPTELWSMALRVARHLEEEIEPVEGVLTRQFSPAGPEQRMYFLPESASRLDACLSTLRAWSNSGWIREPEVYFLLAAIIDAADRVANISGTYGAFLKAWQWNAQRPVELRFPALVSGPLGQANRVDVSEWLAGVDADLLYVDPPYNQRQYASNYHVPELIARIPFAEDLDALEASLYGKTGLLPWEDRRSDLCRKNSERCAASFRDLLLSTSIPRVIVSYSEEGIMGLDQIEDTLAEYAGARAEFLTRVSHPRFRSDADGRVSRSGAGRQYRQLDGRARDEVHEWLFHARKGQRA